MNSECINWTGSKWSQGRYGMDTIDDKCMGAHRAAWIRANGDIPDDLVVCHKCDNGLCVNINHLFLGTSKDNMDDCISKGRKPFLEKQSGANNFNARSDYEFIRAEAIRLRKTGLSYNSIKKALQLKSNGHARNLVLSETKQSQP